MSVRNVALAETKGLEPLTNELLKEEGVAGADESEKNEQ
jgi:hypothetical protein